MRRFTAVLVAAMSAAETCTTVTDSVEDAVALVSMVDSGWGSVAAEMLRF